MADESPKSPSPSPPPSPPPTFRLSSFLSEEALAALEKGNGKEPTIKVKTPVKESPVNQKGATIRVRGKLTQQCSSSSWKCK